MTAIVVALAAGLAAMAARFAPDDWGPRTEIVARAEALRSRVEPLADADAEAYARYLETRELDPIVDTPLAVAEAGAEIAELAAIVAAEGNPTVHGDAAAAAVLAAAGTRISARLVAINLGDADDPRRAAAEQLARRAEAAALQALGSDR